MKTSIFKTTMALALGAVLFTGCGIDDLGENESFDPFSVGNKTDVLTVTRTNAGKGFLVFWSKRAGSYGEVIYTNSIDKSRGSGTPLTANVTGTYSMLCTMTSSDANEARFSCNPSNVTYTKTVTLETGVQYQWLVSYGLNHEKGEVEATMEYQGNGTITVE